VVNLNGGTTTLSNSLRAAKLTKCQSILFVVLSRPIAAEAFCGLLATLGDFIHSDHYHLWTLPMNGAHNHNAAR
jgi:hypothetical protein